MGATGIWDSQTSSFAVIPTFEVVILIAFTSVAMIKVFEITRIRWSDENVDTLGLGGREPSSSLEPLTHLSTLAPERSSNSSTEAIRHPPFSSQAYTSQFSVIATLTP